MKASGRSLPHAWSSCSVLSAVADFRNRAVVICLCRILTGLTVERMMSHSDHLSSRCFLWIASGAPTQRARRNAPCLNRRMLYCLKQQTDFSTVADYERRTHEGEPRACRFGGAKTGMAGPSVSSAAGHA